jgi:hypothetical protein
VWLPFINVDHQVRDIGIGGNASICRYKLILVEDEIPFTIPGNGLIADGD